MKVPQRKIILVVQNNNYQVNKGDITLFADLILKKYRPQGEWDIYIILVNHEKIIQLNKRFFKKNYPTDVISFNLDANHSDFLSGEIYIDVDQAAAQARDLGITLRNELLRLTAHGILHLLGYTDENEQNRKFMTELENQSLLELSRYDDGKNPLTIS